MEVLAIIAALCQVPTGAILNRGAVELHQIECQKYYVRCLKLNKNYTYSVGQKKVSQCILERTK